MCITPGVLLNSVGVSTSTKPGKEQQSHETFHYQSLNNTCTSTSNIYDVFYTNRNYAETLASSWPSQNGDGG